MNHGVYRAAVGEGNDLARRSLRERVESAPGWRLAGEAVDARRTLELIESARPDLVLLAFRIPGSSALEVLRAIEPERRPAVVFLEPDQPDVLAAMREFGQLFLRSPYDEAAVHARLDDVARALRSGDRRAAEGLGRWIGPSREPQPLTRLPIRTRGRVEVIDLASVDWIGAAGNYVELHVAGRRHLHRSPLSEFLDRLDPRRFVRIHRSTVVNAERVRGYEATPQGDYKLRLSSGEQVRLSRRFQEARERLLPPLGRREGQA